MEDHGLTQTAMFLSSGDKTDIAQFQNLKPSLLMLKGSEVVNRKISKHLLGSVACTQKRENKQLTEQFMTIIWYQKQCFGIFHTMSSVISAVCHNFASWQY